VPALRRSHHLTASSTASPDLRRRHGPLTSLLAALLSCAIVLAVNPRAAAQVEADEFELRWYAETSGALAGSDGAITDATGDIALAWTDTDDGPLAFVSITSAVADWTIGLATGGEQLDYGTWTGAVGELDGSGSPLLAVNIDGNECAAPIGIFEVLEADIDGSTINALAVDFQLGCGGDAGSTAQTVGALRVNSSIDFDTDRTITGQISYLDGAKADEGRACAISATSAANSRCAMADRWGHYEIADLEPDTYFVSFTAPEGALACFDAQDACASATYLSLREPAFVNAGIDASLDVGCAGEVPTIVGTNGPDELTGTSERDVIVGLGGDDVINGLEGNDLLCGGNGNDAIAGGDGDDVLNGGYGDDGLWGQAGDDILSGFGGEDKLRGGDGNDRLSGDYDADDLNGGRGNDAAHGDDGDDLVRGGTGDDLVSGGNGADFVNGNGGEDQVFGGEGNDTGVLGGPRPDVIHGGAGNDVVKGLGGADMIYAGEGNDVVYGGKQNDTIEGGEGTDDCNGGAGDLDAHTGCEVLKNFELD